MNNKDDDKLDYTISATVRMSPADINTHIVPTPPFAPSYPQPQFTPMIDYADEIKALKKEIQELKDMIAEHILLGHQDN